METQPLNTTEIRDRIDAQVNHVSAWTTVLGALEQKAPAMIEIPSSTMGEIARTIQRSVLDIRELVDALVASRTSSES